MYVNMFKHSDKVGNIFWEDRWLAIGFAGGIFMASKGLIPDFL